MSNTPDISDIPEATGISDPPADYAEYADYPEAHAATTQPLVSLPEPPAAEQSTAPTVPASMADQSVVLDTPAIEASKSVNAIENSSVIEAPKSASAAEDSSAIEAPKSASAVENTAKATIDNTEGQEDNLWHKMLPQLKLGGMTQQLAEHCLFKSQSDNAVSLLLEGSGETLLTASTEEALTAALQQHLNKQVKLEFEVVSAIGETPEKRRIRLRQERQAAAEQAIIDDPVIQQLQQKWGGVVIPGSVKPNRDVDTS